MRTASRREQRMLACVFGFFCRSKFENGMSCRGRRNGSSRLGWMLCGHLTVQGFERREFIASIQEGIGKSNFFRLVGDGLKSLTAGNWMSRDIDRWRATVRVIWPSNTGQTRKRASQVTPNLFTTENGKSYRYSLIEITWVSFPQVKVWLKGGDSGRLLVLHSGYW